MRLLAPPDKSCIVEGKKNHLVRVVDGRCYWLWMLKG